MRHRMLAGLLLGAACVAIATLPVAQAQRACPHGGYCRPGTCAEWDHGRWACDVRNCKAEHCKPR